MVELNNNCFTQPVLNAQFLLTKLQVLSIMFDSHPLHLTNDACDVVKQLLVLVISLFNSAIAAVASAAAVVLAAPGCAIYQNLHAVAHRVERLRNLLACE